MEIVFSKNGVKCAVFKISDVQIYISRSSFIQIGETKTLDLIFFFLDGK